MLPNRLIDEFLYIFKKSLIKFRYIKLNPDFDLIEKYGHTSDDDAYSSFDKHSLIMYFLSKNFKVDGYDNFLKRITTRTGPVIAWRRINN